MSYWSQSGLGSFPALPFGKCKQVCSDDPSPEADQREKDQEGQERLGKISKEVE